MPPAPLPSNTARAVDTGVYWAPELPTLWPRMLVPRRTTTPLPFPFGAPSLRSLYFARNGVHALVRHFGLQGQEVLFPAYFHGVELEALLAAGARPRFFPVHAGMRVEAADVLALLQPSTRAVYLTHYLGFPGPVEPLRQACDQRGIPLIEDCALSLLSHGGGRPLGSSGDAAIYCLYKTLPTPHGGAVVLRGEHPLAISGARRPSTPATARHVLSLLLRNLEWRGLAPPVVRRTVSRVRSSTGAVDQGRPVPVGTDHFEARDAGLLASRLTHTIVRAQPFSTLVETRRRNYLHLRDLVGDVAPPVFPELPEGVCPLSYAFTTPRKERVWAWLRAAGVEAVNFWSVGHPSVPPGAFPEVDALRRMVLEVPCHQDLSPERMERVAGAVRQAVATAG